MSDIVRRLSDGDADILRELEADARAEADAVDPWADWSDEDFRDFERQLHAETHAVYLARVLEAAPVEADELEGGAPW
jgi:hypothetical protein